MRLLSAAQRAADVGTLGERIARQQSEPTPQTWAVGVESEQYDRELSEHREHQQYGEAGQRAGDAGIVEEAREWGGC